MVKSYKKRRVNSISISNDTIKLIEEHNTKDLN